MPSESRPPSPKWVTLAEAAKYTAIPHRTWRHWCATEKAPAKRYGRAWYLDIASCLNDEEGNLRDYALQILDNVSQIESCKEVAGTWVIVVGPRIGKRIGKKVP